jgi:Icc-related predicted phosphoesterase
MSDLCFFVSDLHGKKTRYETLFRIIRERKPALVLLGGDLLPHPRISEYHDFIKDYLALEVKKLQEQMASAFPFTGLILGNDDARIFEASAEEAEAEGLWHYLHFKRKTFGKFDLVGYSYIPPTPFLLKDWERYDVSRFVDPGCVPPTEGKSSFDIPQDEAEYCTIAKDLKTLNQGGNPRKTIFLFHAPPYQSWLDRAGLDGRFYDHVPLDVHVGSIAIQRFIQEEQPYITLHGHIHESPRITGHWQQQFGSTFSFSAAYDGEELALVSFPLSAPEKAQRELL